MEDVRKTAIHAQIGRINLKRLLYILTLMFLVETLFLFYVERIRLIEATGEMAELVMVSYLLHLSLTLFIVAMFIFVYRLYKKGDYAASIVRRLPIIIIGVTLIISAVISTFDQITVGHITLFTAKMLVFGLLIYIQPPRNWVVYTVPFLLFILGITFFQEDGALLLTHLINGTVVYAGILFTSTYFFHHKYKDIHQSIMLKKMNKRLEALSTLDPLTTLPNRRYFHKQITYEKAIAKRYGTRSSLLLIDIDDFKGINDTYGHNAGDKILEDIAHILKTNVRESDTVSRWGGEEFMLLLSHTTIEGAEILAGRLLKAIREHTFDIGETTVQITVSIGVAPMLEDSDFETSYEQVDQALYQSKQQGKNRYTVKKTR